MTVIASPPPASTRSTGRLTPEFEPVFPAQRSGRAESTGGVAHRHGRGGQDEPGTVHGGRSDGTQAWATLKLKVSETFAALAGTGATAASGTAASAGTGTEAAKEAGSTTVRLQMEIKVAGSGDAFEGAMKSFVQALYGALQALFNPQAAGGSDKTGSDRTGSEAQPIKVAPPDLPQPAPPAGLPGVAPGEPDPTSEPGTAASAAVITVAPTKTATSEPAGPVAAPSRSLSLQVRLSYGGGVNGNLGSLVGQLAHQQSAAAATKDGAAGTDLAASFKQLLAASPAASAAGTTLAGFLQALARSFGEPSSQPPEPVSEPMAETAATSAAPTGGRYALAASYSAVQGDTRVSVAFRVETGPRAPAPVAAWA